MAVVAVYHYPYGTVCVHDDAYRDAVSEELKQREERMWRVAYDMVWSAEKRQREQNDEKVT